MPPAAPTEDFWIAFLGKLPPFVFTIAGILILVGMVVSIVWLMVGAKRVAQAMGREDNVLRLTEQLSQEREHSRHHGELASQAVTALNNIRAHINSLNKLRESQPTYIFELLQRVVEATAADVKHRSGERHRCGLWMERDGELHLLVASAGFPAHYVGHRILNVHQSVAGRAYRRAQAIKLDDVCKDADWEANSESPSRYMALICLPVLDNGRPWAVLTIDALGPMTDEDLSIGELYASLIEVIGGEMARNLAAAGHEPTAQGVPHTPQ